MPPVAIGVATPTVTSVVAETPGASTSSFSRTGARPLFHRAKRVVGLHRVTVDIRPIEAGDVDAGDDIFGKHPIERRVQSHDLAAERSQFEVRAKARGGLVARDNV
jgi:hypothetical protein